VNALPAEQVERRRVPLAAVYELISVPPKSESPAVQRIAVRGTSAVATLLRHNCTGAAIGNAESANLFARAADVARSVPVYRLEITRDLTRLPEIIAQLNRWHLGKLVGDVGALIR
jgi:hypothetical protein